MGIASTVPVLGGVPDSHLEMSGKASLYNQRLSQASSCNYSNQSPHIPILMDLIIATYLHGVFIHEMKLQLNWSSFGADYVYLPGVFKTSFLAWISILAGFNALTLQS